MRKLSLALLFLLSVGLLHAQVTTVTIYCDEGYFPYSYVEGGAAKGAYVDIIQSAAAKLRGYKLEIKPIPWKRCLAMMESGEAFAMFPPYKRPDIRPFMDYVLKLYDEKVVLLLNAKGPYKAGSAWPKDFAGKLIGINAGYSVVDKWKGQIKIDESANNETAIQKLLGQRIDAYANDELVMLATVKQQKATGALPADAAFVVGPTLSTEEAFLSVTTIAAAKFPFKDDFSKQMKAALDAMRASGEIKGIIDRYLK